MKTAVIVTPFDNYSYSVRVKFVEHYLEKNDYRVIILSSDFDHRNKKGYKNSREGLELITVPRYKRNLSFSRIWSHREFARKCVVRVNSIQPDLVYVSGPPNFLFKFFADFKKKNQQIKMIFELGDMWPETIPLANRGKKLLALPLSIWSGLRNSNIGKADFTIFECDLFRSLVQRKTKIQNGCTIYMCKQTIPLLLNECILSEEQIDLVYLGSINNIIDIDLIATIVSRLVKKKRVCVHIIGDGEQREKLISKLQDSGASVKFHGIIYDEIKKREIYNQCHFALNIMKKSVCVGMTMKSIDYFEAGLPLINNIPYDTAKLIERQHCGVNLNENNIDMIVADICSFSTQQIMEMRANSRQLFSSYFSIDVFEKRFDSIISKLMNN